MFSVESVESVDEVERIHRADDPEHRQRAVEGGRNRRPERMEAEISPEPRKKGDCELAEKLEFRRQVPLVVGKAKEKDRRRKRRKAQRMRPNSRTDPAAARCEDIDEERTKKPEEKRGTSAAGNRHLVYAARIGLVHHA